jgi:glucosamine-6-phosphate deaminase
MRPISTVAPEWWDYTTLDREILDDAARLAADDLPGLARPGFKVVFYDTLEDFYLAEALEYITSWRQAGEGQPAGICGPIGPTEQLPLVARLVNELELDLTHAHFWGMDEWVVDGKEAGMDFPLGFARTDMEMCFNRIRPDLRMPAENIHFPGVTPGDYTASWDEVRCVVMQGGQGEVKHWAFNDPPRREGEYVDEPPPPEVYRRLGTRVVGPLETWKAEKVSIWHAGMHDNPFGMRLTTLMISKKIPDTSVPMSLLANHPNVQFNFYRGGIGMTEIEAH